MIILTLEGTIQPEPTHMFANYKLAISKYDMLNISFLMVHREKIVQIIYTFKSTHFLMLL